MVTLYPNKFLSYSDEAQEYEMLTVKMRLHMASPCGFLHAQSVHVADHP